MSINRVYFNIIGSSMKLLDYWNNVLYCINNLFKLL